MENVLLARVDDRLIHGMETLSKLFVKLEKNIQKLRFRNVWLMQCVQKC